MYRLCSSDSGVQTRSFGQQDPVNVQAAEKLGKLGSRFSVAMQDAVLGKDSTGDVKWNQ